MQPLLTMELPPAPIAARVARHALGAFNGQLGDAHEDVLLLVSELVTNAVRHAALAPDQHVDLRVWRTGQQVRVEIHDDGRDGGPQVRDTPPGTAGGWGLRLVDAMAGRWGVEREAGTTVWFELPLRS